MADYNVNMKQWNGNSFDNVLPLAYNALKFNGKTYSDFSKVETGNYVGTGTYGEDNPTTIMCPFRPKMLIIGFLYRYGSSWDYYSGYYYEFGDLGSSPTGMSRGNVFPSIIIDDGFESAMGIISQGSSDYGFVLHKTFTDDGVSFYAKWVQEPSSSRVKLSGSNQFNAEGARYSYLAIG